MLFFLTSGLRDFGTAGLRDCETLLYLILEPDRDLRKEIVFLIVF